MTLILEAAQPGKRGAELDDQGRLIVRGLDPKDRDAIQDIARGFAQRGATKLQVRAGAGADPRHVGWIRDSLAFSSITASVEVVGARLSEKQMETPERMARAGNGREATEAAARLAGEQRAAEQARRQAEEQRKAAEEKAGQEAARQAQKNRGQDDGLDRAAAQEHAARQAAAWRQIHQQFGMSGPQAEAAQRQWFTKTGDVQAQHAAWRSVLNSDPKAAAVLARAAEQRMGKDPAARAQWQAMELSAGDLPRRSTSEILRLQSDVSSAIGASAIPGKPYVAKDAWQVLKHDVHALDRVDARALVTAMASMPVTTQQGKAHRDAMVAAVRDAWTAGRPDRQADQINAPAAPKADPIGQALMADRDDPTRLTIISHLGVRLSANRMAGLVDKVGGPQGKQFADDLRRASEVADVLEHIEHANKGMSTEAMLHSYIGKRMEGMDEEQIAALGYLAKLAPERYGEEAPDHLDAVSGSVRPGSPTPTENARDLHDSLTLDQWYNVQAQTAAKDPIGPGNHDPAAR